MSPRPTLPRTMRRFHVTTFGCQMNEHDSERLQGMLEGLGYTFAAGDWTAPANDAAAAAPGLKGDEIHALLCASPASLLAPRADRRQSSCSRVSHTD